MKNRIRVRVAAFACVLAIALAPSAAFAGEKMYNEGGLGVASALASLVYGPVKIIYATCGLVFGGIAWGLSGGDTAVMQAVLTPSVRGDYVITPAHLAMDRKVEFLGREPGYREVRHASVSDDVVSDDYPVSDYGTDYPDDY